MSKKEQIIDAALERFCYYGFSKTSMNEIAEDLNITKANLYYYYPDKTSLIRDVIHQLSEEMIERKKPIVEKFDGGVIGTFFAVLDLHADFMRKYYVLHINENLEWIKGLELENLLVEMREKDIKWVFSILKKGVDNGEIVINNLENVSLIFLETMNGLALTRTVKDIISGIPDKSNVEEIVKLQKQAVELLVKGLEYTPLKTH